MLHAWREKWGALLEVTSSLSDVVCEPGTMTAILADALRDLISDSDLMETEIMASREILDTVAWTQHVTIDCENKYKQARAANEAREGREK
jgi:hypothetical protein